MIIHYPQAVLEDKGQMGPSTIRTLCGKVVKQWIYIDREDDTDCERCLAVKHPSNEQEASDGSFLCFYCLGIFPYRQHEFDHKIPRSRGGPDILANLVDSCRKCNRAKGDMTAQEFLRTFK